MAVARKIASVVATRTMTVNELLVHVCLNGPGACSISLRTAADVLTLYLSITRHSIDMRSLKQKKIICFIGRE